MARADRRSVRALRPEQLEDATLGEAIGELTRGWSALWAIPADLDTIGTVRRATAEIETVLFRVAKESLSNIAKHAQATKVHLTLTYLADSVLIDVADDGVGFDPTTNTGGYGLVGMRERVSGVAGTFSVESTPGHDATINAAVPIPSRAPAATETADRPVGTVK